MAADINGCAPVAVTDDFDVARAEAGLSGCSRADNMTKRNRCSSFISATKCPKTTQE